MDVAPDPDTSLSQLVADHQQKMSEYQNEVYREETPNLFDIQPYHTYERTLLVFV